MNDKASRDDLAPLAQRVQELRDLIDHISMEIGAGAPRTTEATLARYRAQVYAAMDALGHAVHAYQLTNPTPDRLQTARRMVVDAMLEWSSTSPVFHRGQQTGLQLFNHELILLMNDVRISGADAPALILNDYYLHSASIRAVRNRLQLIGEQLYAEVQQTLSTGVLSPRVVSLQHDGGATLMPLAKDPAVAGKVQILCVDGSASAIRHAIRTLGPVFGRNIHFQKTDVRRWLYGPDCERESAHIVYAFSLLELCDDSTVVSLLRGAHQLLCKGGVLLAGSVTPGIPLGERGPLDWVLGGVRHYRTEEEWRHLLAMTPFTLHDVSFGYEPLHIDLLLAARRVE